MTPVEVRWVAETTRLYRRYESELVDAHGLCPYAAQARRDGRVRELVLLQRDMRSTAPSLAAIDALDEDADLVLLIYPRLPADRAPFEQFAAPSGAKARRDFGKLAAKLAHRFGKCKFGESMRDSDPNFSHREITIRRCGTDFPNVT